MRGRGDGLLGLCWGRVARVRGRVVGEVGGGGGGGAGFGSCCDDPRACSWVWGMGCWVCAGVVLRGCDGRVVGGCGCWMPVCAGVVLRG